MSVHLILHAASVLRYDASSLDNCFPTFLDDLRDYSSRVLFFFSWTFRLVAQMREKANAYRVLVGKTDAEGPLGKPKKI
jgi:hypothetical protein